MEPLNFAALASQKINYMCEFGSTGEANWFQKEWAKTGKKLDMGKSCIRFKKLDDLAFDVIG